MRLGGLDGYAHFSSAALRSTHYDMIKIICQFTTVIDQSLRRKRLFNITYLDQQSSKKFDLQYGYIKAICESILRNNFSVIHNFLRFTLKKWSRTENSSLQSLRGIFISTLVITKDKFHRCCTKNIVTKFEYLLAVND